MEDSAGFFSKEQRVLRAKIQTKKGELEYTGQTGPIILGVIGLFAILAYGLGIIMIIIAIVWSNSREATKKRLENEIKELEAEIE